MSEIELTDVLIQLLEIEGQNPENDDQTTETISQTDEIPNTENNIENNSKVCNDDKGNIDEIPFSFENIILKQYELVNFDKYEKIQKKNALKKYSHYLNALLLQYGNNAKNIYRLIFPFFCI